MKNKILFILVLVLLFLFCFKNVSASELCSSSGYTVLTVNGIFTNENGAKANKNNLKRSLPLLHNNQKLTVDFLYNPTHLAGLGDLVDAIAQGLFDQKSDYDLVEILNDASQKVTTQKVLLIAHSQGNFYANNFYDKTASQPGGVPVQSIGVYSVATPANRVAGGGKYLTSDTDNVIASVVSRFLEILPPNIHIPLKNDDGNGHSFSDVYLKYQGSKIVSDIEFSLNQLQENDEQELQEPCISPPDLDTVHKIVKAIYTVADPTAGAVKIGLINTYKGGVYIADSAYNVGATIGDAIHNTSLAVNKIVKELLANAVDSLPDTNSVTTILSEISEPAKGSPSAIDPQARSSPDNSSQEQTPVVVEEVTTNETIADEKTTVIELPLASTEKENINSVLPNVVVHGSAGRVLTSQSEANPPPEENPPSLTPSMSDPIPEPTPTPSTLDTTAPVITILGNNPEIIAISSVYDDAGATAIDEVDGVLVATTTDIVDTTIIGAYTITYTATDLSGNTANKTRTVIIDDGAKLNRPNFVTVSGNYAYVVSDLSNSLEIIDISNPSVLIHKGSIVHGTDGAALFSPKAVAVSGNYAYVVSYSNALEVIDISNPVLPIHRSTLYNTDGGAQLVRPISIIISGNYAYIATNGYNNVEIVDISNPIDPVHKGTYFLNLLSMPSSIFVSGNYMYLTFKIVGQNGGGLQIIDISNPALPVLRSAINDGTDDATISSPSSVFVSSNYAYVTSWDTKSLEIVDISDPTNPIHKGKLTNGFENPDNFTPNYIFVSGDYTYITSYVGETLEIVDISDPANPVHKKSLANGANGAALSYPTSIFISGNYAYITSSMNNALEVVDISDPTNPIHKNKILNGEFNHTDPIIIPVLSSAKLITSFNFTNLTPEVIGIINEIDHAVSLTIPFGTDVTALIPSIIISDKASVDPNDNTAQDFTNPITYTITAEDNSTQDYIVTVTIAPNPNPPSTPDPAPDATAPTITSYIFNEIIGNITINPLINPLSIVLTASENVNWMSIKIENQDDESIYKIFQSGIGCVDGTDTCTKSWDGLLSGGGLLQNGTFRVKVHIKDSAENEFWDYLSPYIITVDTSI